MHLLQGFLLDEDAPMDFRRTAHRPGMAIQRLLLAKKSCDQPLNSRLLEIAGDGDDDLAGIVMRIDVAQEIRSLQALNRRFTA